MGWSPPGDRRTYDPSINRQRQTEGDTPRRGGGKISTSPQGCQSAVGREVTEWLPRRRPQRRARRAGRKRSSNSVLYVELHGFLGACGPPFFCAFFGDCRGAVDAFRGHYYISFDIVSACPSRTSSWASCSSRRPPDTSSSGVSGKSSLPSGERNSPRSTPPWLACGARVSWSSGCSGRAGALAGTVTG